MTGWADALTMVKQRNGSHEAAKRRSEQGSGPGRSAAPPTPPLRGSRRRGVHSRSSTAAPTRRRDRPRDRPGRPSRDRRARHPQRPLISVAPTGTMSLLANNVSRGVEPVFALAYTRKILQPNATRIEEEVSGFALWRFRAQFSDDTPLPNHFVIAQDLTPAEHVPMQAAVQRYVDSAISKTVNVPEDIRDHAGVRSPPLSHLSVQIPVVRVRSTSDTTGLGALGLRRAPRTGRSFSHKHRQ